MVCNKGDMRKPSTSRDGRVVSLVDHDCRRHLFEFVGHLTVPSLRGKRITDLLQGWKHDLETFLAPSPRKLLSIARTLQFGCFLFLRCVVVASRGLLKCRLH